MTTDQGDRAMPADLDAERIAIGAALLSRDALEDVTTTIRPEDLWAPHHETILAAITTLHAQGQPVDAVIVTEYLTRTGDLKRVGGAAYLHQCISTVPTAANGGYYASIVRDRADSRALVTAGTRLIQAGHHLDDVHTAKATARRTLDDLDTRDTTTRPIADSLGAIYETAESGTARGTPTPWPELDQVLGGLRPGLHTVGSRPGNGKTMVGAGIAWHTALRGDTALVFSLEMSADDYNRRIVSAVAAVDYGRLLRGGVRDWEWEQLRQCQNLLLEAPLLVDDRSTLTVHDIAATTRHHHRGGRLGVVVVDYLQLVTPVDRRIPREQQVSEISRALKILSGDLQVPVVLMAQLNREVEKRHDKHPMLSDLRESGSIEQDSDTVMLLFRDEEKEPEWLDVGVGKNRWGRTGPVSLRWEGHYQRVSSPSLRAVS